MNTYCAIALYVSTALITFHFARRDSDDHQDLTLHFIFFPVYFWSKLGILGFLILMTMNYWEDGRGLVSNFGGHLRDYRRRRSGTDEEEVIASSLGPVTLVASFVWMILLFVIIPIVYYLIFVPIHFSLSLIFTDKKSK